MAESREVCERLPLPLLLLLIAPCDEAEEARRGEERGINYTHSPTTRDYYALKACRNRRRKTCGRFWATENPRLGPGVGVAGPRPAATSRRAHELAGFLTKRGHVVRRRQVAGPRPGARAGELPPSDSKKFSPRRRPQPKSAPSCRLVKIGS